MFSDLNVFRLAHSMAAHAGQRQAVIARNVANADTPNYVARDIAPFSSGAPANPNQMRATRNLHFGTKPDTADYWPVVVGQGAADPNQNSVSVELELMKAVEVKGAHDRALAIYKSSLNILRSSLGRR